MTPSEIEPVTLRLLASINFATACPILPDLDTLNWFLSTLRVGGLLTTSTSATNISSSTEFHKAAQQMTWTLTLFLLHASIPLQREDYFSLCPPSFPYHLHIHKFPTSSVFDTGAHTANLLVILLMCPLGFRGLLLDFRRKNKMGS